MMGTIGSPSPSNNPSARSEATKIKRTGSEEAAYLEFSSRPFSSSWLVFMDIANFVHFVKTRFAQSSLRRREKWNRLDQ